MATACRPTLNESMDSSVRTLAKYWKYAESEIQLSLAEIWHSSFLSAGPLTKAVSSILYQIVVQNEVSGSLRGIAIEVLLLSEVLPVAFINNFAGRFHSYIKSGSWDTLRLLFSLECSQEQLLIQNAPLLLNSLIHLATDESVEDQHLNYLSLPAVSHCLKYFPNFMNSSNRRSFFVAIERLLLNQIAILVNHRVQTIELYLNHSIDPHDGLSSDLSIGYITDLICSLSNIVTIPDTLIAIFYKFATMILENEDHSQLMGLHSAILIDIVKVLEKIAISGSEESVKVQTFLSEICMRFDEIVSLSAFDSIISITGALSSSALEKLTQIACNFYTDPMIAYTIVKLVDKHFEQLQKMSWIEKWFPVMFKLSCSRPLCYTKYLIRWMSMRNKQTSTILTSVLNLPCICSTIEFSQQMNFDAHLKTSFCIAVKNNHDVLRVYTNLLRNCYDISDSLTDLPRNAISDMSLLWLRPSFRVNAICSTLVPLINSFFESEFSLGVNLRTSATIAIENFSSWSIGNFESVISMWVVKAFERCPKLLIELQDPVKECVSKYLLSERQEFVSTLIYCIGEAGIRCQQRFSFAADYEDFLKKSTIQLLNHMAEHGQSRATRLLPPWCPYVPGASIPAQELSSDIQSDRILVCITLTALAKLSIAMSNKQPNVFEFIEKENCSYGALIGECLHELKELVANGTCPPTSSSRRCYRPIAKERQLPNNEEPKT